MQIVVLEGKKKEAEKGDIDIKEASKTNQTPAQENSENDDNEKKSSDNLLTEKSQVICSRDRYKWKFLPVNDLGYV